jgi:hypothetical protein
MPGRWFHRVDNHPPSLDTQPLVLRLRPVLHLARSAPAVRVGTRITVCRVGVGAHRLPAHPVHPGRYSGRSAAFGACAVLQGHGRAEPPPSIANHPGYPDRPCPPVSERSPMTRIATVRHADPGVRPRKESSNGGDHSAVLPSSTDAAPRRQWRQLAGTARWTNQTPSPRNGNDNRTPTSGAKTPVVRVVRVPKTHTPIRPAPRVVIRARLVKDARPKS